MAVALRKQGIENFRILERAQDVGGVWRDNSYPGAACDVPSHLYSFSFEPNPNWSHVFAPQKEIYSYLQHCAHKYDLLRHIQFGAEVAGAEFDEARSIWRVTLVDGTTLESAMLITATGQLSLPAYPRLPGIETFKGHTFHSAHWDSQYALSGKRIAVIGTGASAIQFVPAIADQVKQLKVFQRSPAHIIPRPDRAYSKFEHTLFEHVPQVMKAYRTGIYLQYESRAIAFTKFKGLMKVAVGIPAKRLLAKQVPDATLRAKLLPDYPIGCKRILLSSEYLATMAKPNVDLITDGIKQITADGVETVDGKHHPVDAIIYGTGFAATEFLSPMRIQGRKGLNLNDAWQGGAAAYRGLTVPDFPNFFMLYGPNTNLGHNSIVYMLESQIEHVMRCWKTMQATQTNTVEVDATRYQQYNGHIQQRLVNTVWNGCKSWYVDATGHNSTNWPGFTLTYRWLTNHASLQAYTFSKAEQSSGFGEVDVVAIAEPQGSAEQLKARFLRGFLRTGFRTLIGPPFGVVSQRRVVSALSQLMPGRSGTLKSQVTVDGLSIEVITPEQATSDSGVILYLHGGAFCLGAPATHRSITTHLAVNAGMSVWVPDYRLAPEHPYPAALDDAESSYHALLKQGYSADQIVIAGDSAGGSLAIALGLRLRDQGALLPAGLLLLSPVTDSTLSGTTLKTHQRKDPMIRLGWLQQGLGWYASQDASVHQPLEQNLRGLPPMLIQVGDQEILRSDSTRLAEHATQCGVDCKLEIYSGRWHVFQLQSFYLSSAKLALHRLADFARACVKAQSEEHVALPSLDLAAVQADTP